MAKKKAATKKATTRKKPATRKVKAAKPKALTPKEKLFCECYLVHLNGRRAAREAKYKDETNACKMLQRPEIRKYIAESLSSKLDAVGIEAEDVIREIAYSAFAKVDDVVRIETLDGADGDLFRADEDGNMIPQDEAKVVRILDSEHWGEQHHHAVAGIKVDKNGNIELKFNDKLKSLELLAKRFNLLTDNQTNVQAENVFITLPEKEPDEDKWEAKAQDQAKPA